MNGKNPVGLYSTLCTLTFAGCVSGWSWGTSSAENSGSSKAGCLVACTRRSSKYRAERDDASPCSLPAEPWSLNC